MGELKGVIKFSYGDNRFSARKNLAKDLNKLSTVDALNKEGVSYNHSFDIVNEAEEGWMPDGRYYAEVKIEISGSDLRPSEMKSEIESSLEDLNNLSSVFIYD